MVRELIQDPQQKAQAENRTVDQDAYFIQKIESGVGTDAYM